MMVTKTVIEKKNMKIKVASQRIEAVPGKQSCDSRQFEQTFSFILHNPSLDENEHSDTSKSRKSMIPSSDAKTSCSSESKERSSMPGVNKRGPQVVIEPQRVKRQRMDRSVTQQCSVLLKTLMGHPAGWVFNKPVDPVGLGIPDYFSIISKPMDLGTIKSKLEKNMYTGSEGFASDIRLTFSNAMLYNPPDNNVHKMAEELNGIFEMRWESLEEKWNHEILKAGQGKYLPAQPKEINGTRQNCLKLPPLRSRLVPKKSKSSEAKAIRSSSDARAAEGRFVKPAVNSEHKFIEKCKLKKDFPKGMQCQSKVSDNDGRPAFSSVSAKQPLSPVVSNCGACQCSLSSDSTHASSDISSERSLGRDHPACGADASKPLYKDCQSKSTSMSQTSKSDPDSDGAVSALDGGNVCSSSQLTSPATDAASGDGWKTPLFDVQLSPKKALRAAMLKSRFADTILKAQQKTLHDHGDNADPVKMKQEKERLEKRQREEKARIEAQIRAAKDASRMKAETQLKRQREKEREAARIALQKMEKTVEFEHNLEILKELEMLSGCPQSYQLLDRKDGSVVVMGTFVGFHSRKPLERLGLLLKDDYLDVEDDETILGGDGEEGEILL